MHLFLVRMIWPATRKTARTATPPPVMVGSTGRAHPHPPRSRRRRPGPKGAKAHRRRAHAGLGECLPAVGGTTRLGAEAAAAPIRAAPGARRSRCASTRQRPARLASPPPRRRGRLVVVGSLPGARASGSAGAWCRPDRWGHHLGTELCRAPCRRKTLAETGSARRRSAFAAGRPRSTTGMSVEDGDAPSRCSPPLRVAGVAVQAVFRVAGGIVRTGRRCAAPPLGLNFWIDPEDLGYRPFVRAIRRFTAPTRSAPALAPLEELAGNLRWSWHPPTQDVFAAVDPQKWDEVKYDPARLSRSSGGGSVVERAGGGRRVPSSASTPPKADLAWRWRCSRR